MIAYAFTDQHGRYHERLYEPGKAPKIGRTITVRRDEGGRPLEEPLKLTRMACIGQRAVATDYGHWAYSLPRKGEPGDVGAPYYDPETGIPRVNTRSEIKEIEARRADIGKPIKWG